MIFIQTVKMAMKSILGNKKRSFLTMLGIIIGVMSVITLIGLASASTSSVTSSLEEMGTNLISVMIQGRNGSSRSIDLKDVESFANNNKNIVDSIIPSISGKVTAKYSNENMQTTIEGTNEKYETARSTKPTKGRFITAIDVEQRSNVALIGTYVKKELYGNEDPIGKTLKLNGQTYYVIGVVEEKSSSTANSSDDKVYIPYTSAVRLMGNANLSSFTILCTSSDTTSAVEAKINDYLFSIFNDEDAYYVMNSKDMLDTLSSMTSTLNAMLGGIAGISLVVGGIGIMNIMLVSVTERTREIGVRKAIGASRGTILVQFLIEAIVLSGLGGILGIALGMLAVKVGGSLMGLEASASTGSIILSFAFSLFVGVFFGISPANKASKLRPIEALRSE